MVVTVAGTTGRNRGEHVKATVAPVRALDGFAASVAWIAHGCGFCAARCPHTAVGGVTRNLTETVAIILLFLGDYILEQHI